VSPVQLHVLLFISLLADMLVVAAGSLFGPCVGAVFI